MGKAGRGGWGFKMNLGPSRDFSPYDSRPRLIFLRTYSPRNQEHKQVQDE